MKRCILFLWSLIPFIQNLNAQSNDSTKTFKLNEVVVGAEKFSTVKMRTPQQVTVISKSEINFQNAANAADLMINSGGIFVQKSQGGGGSPIIRGFESNRILLTVDGVRMNNLIFRGGHLQNILRLDNNILSSTEVIQGPGSLIYGSDALGGVINFNTQSPVFSATEKLLLKANAKLRYQSSVAENMGHVDFSIAGTKLGSFTSITYSLFGDMRQGKTKNPLARDLGLFWKDTIYVEHTGTLDTVMQNAKPEIQKLSGYKQYNLFQKLQYRQAGFLHSLSIHYTATGNVNRYDRLSEWRNGKPRNSEWYYGPETWLSTSYRLTDTKNRKLYSSMHVTFAFQQFDESRNTRGFKAAELKSQKEHVDMFTANFDFMKKVNNLDWQYGTEMIYGTCLSTATFTKLSDGVVRPADTRYPGGDNSQLSSSFYTTLEYSIGKKIDVRAGARIASNTLKAEFTDTAFFQFPFSNIEQNNNALSTAISLNYFDMKSTRFTLMLSNGYRSPNLDDMTKVFESGGGVLIIPNPKLKPEYNINYEATLSHFIGNSWQLEATGFYMDVRNIFALENSTLYGKDSIIYDGSPSIVRTTVNKDHAYINGFTGNISCFISHSWSFNIKGSYTYGRIINKDTSNTPLDHIPPFAGRAGINFEHNKLRTEFYVLLNGAKKLRDYRLNAEDNEIYATPDGIPAWYTLNIKASYQLSRLLQAQAGIENMMDIHYRYFASGISAPGRNFMLALSLNL